MLLPKDPVNAFLPYPPVEVESAADGPLAGLTLGIKDLFDVKGYRTGCGCPLWLAQSEVAYETAPAVQLLLDAGARFVGKTHTDELAWSLYGLNAHFGTPINSAAPDRIPGGSSSGSAAAVAAGLIDIGIGSDTGGSIRAPASFCGLWGIRPTHGRVSLERCMPLAPSLDTCGILTRDPETLLKSASVLVGEDRTPLPTSVRFLRPVDMIARLGAEQRAVYEAACEGIETQDVTVYPVGGSDRLYETFRILQSHEAKRTVVPFIQASGMPLLGGIADRAAFAARLTEADEAAGNAVRGPFRAAMNALLGTDGVLLVPPVHDAPFHRDAPPAVLEAFRHDAMKLLSVAGLAGLPQLVMPAGKVGGAPYGVSLIGPRGSDVSLVRLAGSMFAH
ncbi:amidase [Jiella marina]|uniref:amidase n=1 Tax=Jiella sp. LLJ827 TaxID=2917712 RepID=UPI0021019A51|nr:amidase [Jiella sp. LLJ827]MCQ0987409.1 amidase [Jiella sp. LLJ827]